MKVAFTSDIHSDITKNNRLLLPFIIKELKELSPDIFIIAGDTSNSLEELEKSLSLFEDFSGLKVFTPGNHDLWIESSRALSKGRDSLFKYHEAIPAICSRQGFIMPNTTPYIIENCAVISNPGWYDYSLADSRLLNVYSYEDYSTGRFENLRWNDIKYARFLTNRESKDWKVRKLEYNNSQVFNLFYQELKKALESLDDKIRKVIISLHTAPFADCIIPKNEPCPFDAYEGSVKLGRLFEEHSNERKIHVVIGHRHRPLYLEKGNITVYRSPVGYLPDGELDLAAIARERLGLFEVK